MIPWYQLPKLYKRRLGLALIQATALLGTIALPPSVEIATAQTSAQQGRPLQIKSDIQEYDAKTQVVTARGNVQMVYPARQIQATAAQAQYFSKERRIDFSGNVYILQQGSNSIRAEKVTYLIDEGRFVALPQNNRQVESIYLVNDANQSGQAATPAPKTPPFKRSN